MIYLSCYTWKCLRIKKKKTPKINNNRFTHNLKLDYLNFMTELQKLAGSATSPCIYKFYVILRTRKINNLTAA